MKAKFYKPFSQNLKFKKKSTYLKKKTGNPVWLHVGEL